MTTLAEYNNNPGNLKPPKGVTYEGQIGVDDKGFAIFEKKEFGQRALINDLKIKIDRGVNTPDKFVDAYDPPGGESDEAGRENYKIYLAQQLGLKSTKDPFPKDATEKLANAVSAFEGGTWYNTKQEEKKAPEAAPEAAPEPSGDAVGGEEDRVKPGTSDIPGVDETKKPALGVIGAQIGAGTASTVEAGKKILPLVPSLISKVTGSEPSPTAPMTRGGLQNYLNSQIPANIRLPLDELERLTGGNKIRTMSEVQNALKAIQEVKAERVAKTLSIDPVTGTPRQVFSTTPGRPAVDLTPYQVKPVGPIRQALGQETKMITETGKSVLPSVGKIGFGALGGANALMQGYDAANMAKRMYEQGDPSWQDWARLASKSASTVGGGLSMLPFGVTQAVGLGLQAPEMVWSGLESLREAQKGATKEQTDRALMNVDPLGNPIGGLP